MVARFGKFALAPGVLLEECGDQAVVLTPNRSEVLSLSGPAAHVLRRVCRDQAVNRDDLPHVQDLVRQGILVAEPSRRAFLAGSAVAAGTGIAVVALPSVAQASSASFRISTFLDGEGDDAPVLTVFIYLENIAEPPLNTTGTLRVVKGNFEQTIPLIFLPNPEGILPVTLRAFRAATEPIAPTIKWASFQGATLILEFGGITITRLF